MPLHPFQAVSNSMMESISNDEIFALINKEEPESWRVNSIMSHALTSCQEGLGSGHGSDSVEFPEIIQATLTRMRDIASAYVAVLNPHVDFLGSSDKHAAIIRSYKGKEAVEAMFSKPLKSGYYSKLADEMLKKGASARMAYPVLKEVSLALVKNYGTESVDAAVSKLPALMDALRKGATYELEGLLMHRLKLSAEQIIEKSAQNITPDQARFANSVFEGLKLFVKEEGVLDLMTSLEEWKGANSMYLTVANLETQVVTVANCKDMARLDLAELSKALAEAGNISKANLSEEQATSFQVAVCNIFRHLKLKVPRSQK